MENGVFHLQNKTTLAGIYYRSPNIWGRLGVLPLIKKYYPEGHVRWDVSRMELIDGAQTTETRGPIPGTKVFSTTALKVNAVSAVNSVEKWGGAITFGGDTDNDSCTLAQAFPTFRMSGNPALDKPLAFEACVAFNSILTDTMGLFVGMGETELFTLATAKPFNGASATITADGGLIGFLKGEDALGVWDTVRSDRATSWTAIGDDEATVSAAYTFIKIGMFYNPLDRDRCLRFFADNVELTTALTRAEVVAFTNLDANALGPIVSAVADASGTATLAYLKWLEVAQMPPGEPV